MGKHVHKALFICVAVGLKTPISVGLKSPILVGLKKPLPLSILTETPKAFSNHLTTYPSYMV